MKIRVVAAVVITLALCAGQGRAFADNTAETSPTQESKKADWWKKVLFGWVEIPKSIVETTRESRNPLWGLTGGAVKGMAKAFPRTISGYSEAASLGASGDAKTSTHP